MRTTPVFAEGWVGVEIFFVLSGFVIAYSTEGATPSRFVRHRWQRLFPAALLCASLTGLVRLYNGQALQSVGQLWLRSIVFSPAGPWIDGSYWTLPVEMAFYLLVFLSLLWAKGRHLVTMMSLLGAGSAVCCVLLLTMPQWVKPGVLGFINSCWFPPHACWLAVYGVFFALGVLIFSALQHGIRWQHLLVVPVCLAGCVAEICWHEQGSATNAHRPVRWSYPVAIWFFAMAVLVASVRWNKEFRDLLGVRGVAITRQIGLVTYPLYLVHAEIGEWLMHGFNHRIGYPASLVLVSFCMITVGSVIALQLEPRLRRLIRRPTVAEAA